MRLASWDLWGRGTGRRGCRPPPPGERQPRRTGRPSTTKQHRRVDGPAGGRLPRPTGREGGAVAVVTDAATSAGTAWTAPRRAVARPSASDAAPRGRMRALAWRAEGWHWHSRLVIAARDASGPGAATSELTQKRLLGGATASETGGAEEGGGEAGRCCRGAARGRPSTADRGAAFCIRVTCQSGPNLSPLPLVAYTVVAPPVVVMPG